MLTEGLQAELENCEKPLSFCSITEFEFITQDISLMISDFNEQIKTNLASIFPYTELLFTEVLPDLLEKSVIEPVTKCLQNLN